MNAFFLNKLLLFTKMKVTICTILKDTKTIIPNIYIIHIKSKFFNSINIRVTE